MNNLFVLLSSLVLGLGAAASSHALTVETDTHQKKINQQEQTTMEPFSNDPFFKSHNDIFKEMNMMQQAMRRLMKSHFSKMHNNLVNRYPDLNSNNLNNIQVKEEKDRLIYKIKLPAGKDNKVNVTVKNRQLIITSNMTQKITHEQDNSKSVSYTNSTNSQSFEIPPGYDEKSMLTKMKETNLIVTLKKIA